MVARYAGLAAPWAPCLCMPGLHDSCLWPAPEQDALQPWPGGLPDNELCPQGGLFARARAHPLHDGKKVAQACALRLSRLLVRIRVLFAFRTACSWGLTRMRACVHVQADAKAGLLGEYRAARGRCCDTLLADAVLEVSWGRGGGEAHVVGPGGGAGQGVG